MIKNSLPLWTNEVLHNQYIDAVREFDVSSNTEKAELEIFADGGYAVFINSKLAATSKYRTFPDKAAYGVYDISSFLNKGKNTLFITAYHQGINTSTDCERVAALCYSINLPEGDIVSDENTMVRLNPFYESGDIEKISNQLGYTFHYNRAAEETPWQRATVVNKFCSELVKCPVESLELKPLVTGRIKTQGVFKRFADGTPAELIENDFMSHKDFDEIFENNIIKKNKDGVYFVTELPEETAGFLYLDIEAPEGTVFDIGYGEHLDDLRVRTYVGRRHFAFRYTAKGKDCFTSHLFRLAAKYLEIHIPTVSDNIKINAVGIIPTEYPIERIARLECNDFLFKRIYDVSIRTMRLCMHEHYEDCPWREQALYAYDSYVQMLSGYYAFGEYKFARASLELLASGILSCGLLPITAPGGAGLTIPCFSLSWIMSLDEYVFYSGDIKFGKSMLAVAGRILSAFRIEDNLLRLETEPFYWNFYEWTKGLDGTTFKDCNLDAPSNLLYVIAYNSYLRLCRVCEVKPAYVDIEGMKKAIYSAFYSTEYGLLRTRVNDDTFHELTQSLAIIAGVCSDSSLADKLANPENQMVKVSLSTSLFKYRALLDMGERYADCVLCEIAKIWGDMIFKGAETLWETAVGADDFENAGSLCHAWSAVPVYLLFRYYIGYYPTKPGFSEYEIKPLANSILTKLDGDLFKPQKL